MQYKKSQQCAPPHLQSYRKSRIGSGNQFVKSDKRARAPFLMILTFLARLSVTRKKGRSGEWSNYTVGVLCLANAITGVHNNITATAD